MQKLDDNINLSVVAKCLSYFENCKSFVDSIYTRFFKMPIKLRADFQHQSEKMILLGTLKKYFFILGIIPISQTSLPSFIQKYQLAINRIHIAIIILLFVHYTVSEFYFLLFDANTFAEYCEGAYFGGVGVLFFPFYFSLVFMWPILVELLDNLEATIEKSK